MKHNAGGRFTGITAAIFGGLLTYASPSSAHHSTAEYDASSFVEARGEVVSVLWRNPHVRFQVSTKAIDGNDALWEVESADLTRLDRAGLPRDLLDVGDVVTFAGNPSTRTERRMYVTNLLVADGREILLRGNVKPRWSQDRAVNTDAIPARALRPRHRQQRLHRQGLRPFARGPSAGVAQGSAADGGGARGQSRLRRGRRRCSVGLRAARHAARDAAQRPVRHPLHQRGTDLVLQNEWFEIDRLIHMDGREPPANQAYTPLGYSAGRWDGDALVITTTHIDWPYFELYGLVGVPQSRAMRIVERFTPRDDGATLQYDWAATDPTNFTETVSYDNYVTFRWNPALDFLPYDCIEDERKARSAR